MIYQSSISSESNLARVPSTRLVDPELPRAVPHRPLPYNSQRQPQPRIDPCRQVEDEDLYFLLETELSSINGCFCLGLPCVGFAVNSALILYVISW